MSNRWWNFYHGYQITDEEKEILREAGMPDFEINRTTPGIDLMAYFCTNGRPRWQAVGREGSDVKMGNAISTMQEYVWDISNGQQVLSSVTLDALTKGLGYFAAYIDPDSDLGSGDVKVRHVDSWKVYADPKSVDPLFRDASFILVKRIYSRSKLLRLHPRQRKKIKKATGRTEYYDEDAFDDFGQTPLYKEGDIKETYLPDGSLDELIDYFEVYTKESKKFYLVTQRIVPDAEEMAKIKEQVEIDFQFFQREEAVKIKEAALALSSQVEAGEMIPERAQLEVEKMERESQQKMIGIRDKMMSEAIDQASIVDQNVLDKKQYEVLQGDEAFEESVVNVVEFNEDRVKMSITAGDQHLEESELPLTEYPIVPVAYKHTGTPYPTSAVTPIIGKQQEINKAHQITIHNANLSSNMRWMHESGAINDEDEWDENSTVPGARLVYNPTQTGNKPEPILPAPLNPAFFALTQEGKNDMEYIMGIYSQMQGATDEAQQTYRGMLATDEYGTRRIKLFIENNLEPALELLGKVVFQLSQAVYTTQKVFRIVQPNAAGGMDEREESINIPMYDDYGEQVGMMNDIKNVNYDIKFVGGSTMPVNRWAIADEYFKFYQAGIIDDIALLQVLDIPDKEKIAERKSLYAQMQNQIESMTEENKELVEQNKAFKRQIEQTMIQSKVKDAERAAQDEVTQTKYQQKLQRDKVANEADRRTERIAQSFDLIEENIADNNEQGEE